MIACFHCTGNKYIFRNLYLIKLSYVYKRYFLYYTISIIISKNREGCSNEKI